jgi:hypothetical protein
MTFPKSNIGAIDRSPIVKPKPCCVRMTITVDGQDVSTWCVLVDGHQGGHESPVRSAPAGNAFGPADAVKRGWGR